MLLIVSTSSRQSKTGVGIQFIGVLTGPPNSQCTGLVSARLMNVKVKYVTVHSKPDFQDFFESMAQSLEDSTYALARSNDVIFVFDARNILFTSSALESKLLQNFQRYADEDLIYIPRFAHVTNDSVYVGNMIALCEGVTATGISMIGTRRTLRQYFHHKRGQYLSTVKCPIVPDLDEHFFGSFHGQELKRSSSPATY
ncbi:hypothetical protein BE221DRAFT_64840, partial [Ostreococcus tauri]